MSPGTVLVDRTAQTKKGGKLLVVDEIVQQQQPAAADLAVHKRLATHTNTMLLYVGSPLPLRMSEGGFGQRDTHNNE